MPLPYDYRFNVYIKTNAFSSTTGNFLLTTDFCYLNETDVDYQVHYGKLRFPCLNKYIKNHSLIHPCRK